MSTLVTPCAPGIGLVSLAAFNTEDGCQTRVSVRRAIVRDYAEAMSQQQSEGGLRFPAVIAYTDSTQLWLADGYHRVLAARQAGLSDILAHVHQGTQRDALLYSISANTEHGLPRTNADKRKAVLLLLADAEWGQWSDREIARRCQVGHVFVSRLRKGASVSGKQMRERKVRRGERVYDMAVLEVKAEAAPSQAAPLAAAIEPEPSAAAPHTDRTGIPIPQDRLPLFTTAALYEQARQLFAELAQVIDRIGQQPGGVLYRQHLQRQAEGTRTVFESTPLRTAWQQLLGAEPYCAYCPLCEMTFSGLRNPSCQVCHGLGWTTQPAFTACPEGHRQMLQRAKEAKDS